MHPGLPCFYTKKGQSEKSELSRGASVKLDDGDVFALHSNPDCEFLVIKSMEKNGTAAPPVQKEVSYCDWVTSHGLSCYTPLNFHLSMESIDAKE